MRGWLRWRRVRHKLRPLPLWPRLGEESGWIGGLSLSSDIHSVILILLQSKNMVCERWICTVRECILCSWKNTFETWVAFHTVETKDHTALEREFKFDSEYPVRVLTRPPKPSPGMTQPRLQLWHKHLTHVVLYIYIISSFVLTFVVCSSFYCVKNLLDRLMNRVIVCLQHCCHHHYL